MIAKLRYWLVRRICRRYARAYLHDVDRMGLEWTLALIDEDILMYGAAFEHTLARAGVIDYARTGGDRLLFSREKRGAHQGDNENG